MQLFEANKGILKKEEITFKSNLRNCIDPFQDEILKVWMFQRRFFFKKSNFKQFSVDNKKIHF